MHYFKAYTFCFLSVKKEFTYNQTNRSFQLHIIFLTLKGGEPEGGGRDSVSSGRFLCV